MPSFETILLNVVSNAISFFLGTLSSSALYRFIRLERRYLPLVLSDSPKFVEQVENEARRHFSRPPLAGLPWPRVKRSTVLKPEATAVEGVLKESSWRELLRRAAVAIHSAERPEGEDRDEEIHLVFGTPILWAFALGRLTQNRHRLVVYHFQNEDQCYHRIWKTDRRVKNLRSPIAGRPFEYRFLRETRIEAKQAPGPGPTRECLVIMIGANAIVDDVVAYRDANLPDAAVRVFTKVRLLNPSETDAWVRAAAEVAYAVCDRGPRVDETCLFVDMPCALAFMAADSIGLYSPRRLRLMQYDQKNKTYLDILSFPDDELDALAG